MANDAEAVMALTSTLLALAEGQSVRAVEALAATLVNRRAAGLDESLPESGCPTPGLCESAPSWRGAGETREAMYRRVARRALSGALHDPTRGATAFHHVDEMPAWARHRAPVAIYGPFLFYLLAPTQ
jgi:hypothetical protein